VVSARQPGTHRLLHDRRSRAAAASPALGPQPRITRARSPAQRRTPHEAGEDVADRSGRDHSGGWDWVVGLLGRGGRSAGFVVEDEIAVVAGVAGGVAGAAAVVDESDRIFVGRGIGVLVLCRVCGGGRAGDARDLRLGCNERVGLLFLLQDRFQARLLSFRARRLGGVFLQFRDIDVEVAVGGVGASLSGLRACLALAAEVRSFTVFGIFVNRARSRGLSTLATSWVSRGWLQ